MYTHCSRLYAQGHSLKRSLRPIIQKNFVCMNIRRNVIGRIVLDLNVRTPYSSVFVTDSDDCDRVILLGKPKNVLGIG